MSVLEELTGVIDTEKWVRLMKEAQSDRELSWLVAEIHAVGVSDCYNAISRKALAVMTERKEKAS